MLRFNIFGIPVLVQPFFWLTLAIIGAANHGGGDSPLAMLGIALFVLAGFISILVHELGHALTARKFGARTQIVLQAFGGYAAYTGVPMTRLRSLLITAAGPGLQILFGIVVAVILRFAPELQPGARYFMHTLVGISWFWALFNLLPIVPLDGGRLLQAALGPQRIRITLWVTIITACLIGLLALATFDGMGRLIIPVFFASFAWQAWQAMPQNRWK